MAAGIAIDPCVRVLGRAAASQMPQASAAAAGTGTAADGGEARLRAY